MKQSIQKQTVTYILHLAATRMLANTPVKSRVQQEAQSKYNQIRAKLPPEEIKSIDFIASIMTSLAGQLTRCEDVSQLEQAMIYVESLEKGEVYQLAPDQEITLQP